MTATMRPLPIGAAHADERLLIPARDAARMLSVSERTLYSMTAPRGPIASMRIGRANSNNPRVLYSVERLHEWIAAQTGGARWVSLSPLTLTPTKNDASRIGPDRLRLTSIGDHGWILHFRLSQT